MAGKTLLALSALSSWAAAFPWNGGHPPYNRGYGTSYPVPPPLSTGTGYPSGTNYPPPPPSGTVSHTYSTGGTGSPPDYPTTTKTWNHPSGSQYPTIAPSIPYPPYTSIPQPSYSSIPSPPPESWCYPVTSTEIEVLTSVSYVTISYTETVSYTATSTETTSYIETTTETVSYTEPYTYPGEPSEVPYTTEGPAPPAYTSSYIPHYPTGSNSTCTESTGSGTTYITSSSYYPTGYPGSTTEYPSGTGYPSAPSSSSYPTGTGYPGTGYPSEPPASSESSSYGGYGPGSEAPTHTLGYGEYYRKMVV
ncbi:hypothetical protein K491DRAFT_684496 [Lophiostoma macrostomum CBS 122681]|uniref:Uncharacterized protein n=1 Tax=Lophiostoma macrostomum CBS 122681 TaxID=1314788 RepID=A0A6A6SLH6_9PLEO|nr:hypothetical protein K491DRAFT_684496 [Lophiostoma macrostomum CBS 122681]